MTDTFKRTITGTPTTYYAALLMEDAEVTELPRQEITGKWMEENDIIEFKSSHTLTFGPVSRAGIYWVAFFDKPEERSLSFKVEVGPATPGMYANLEFLGGRASISDWRPIETAPKDGTHILLATRMGVVRAKWTKDDWWTAMIDDYTEAIDGEGTWVGPDETWTTCEYNLSEVTHWIPVPALPPEHLISNAEYANVLFPPVQGPPRRY